MDSENGHSGISIHNMSPGKIRDYDPMDKGEIQNLKDCPVQVHDSIGPSEFT